MTHFSRHAQTVSAWVGGLVLALSGGAACAATLEGAVDLAKAQGCFSCHGMAEKVVGPAFGAIAAKYQGEAGVAAVLAQSIQNGSKGKWGRVPMPANSGVSAQDAKLLASWILTVKP
jgi:cytochrome c